ncbi:TPA: hypothetical protein VGT13_000793 [Shewanella algae]|uniref:DUF6942 family protein n=1 Tax=Shewanella algae TaxID=38313 RepID=UPI001AAEA685|nr:hypothetical protein [Shewanella algae]MBO2620737.1 hypothetical protein [Shewanella algae]HEW9973859.1 hypothetical protein [Shewanella algae]
MHAHSTPSFPLRIGNDLAKARVYLPNPPTLPLDWHWQQSDAAAALIAANSNHWRKILVICAKIFAPDDDWRSFLQQGLFSQVALEIAATRLATDSGIALIAGNEAAGKLNIAGDAGQELTGAPGVQRLDQWRWKVPYLDYRQFPNASILLLRQALHCNP